MAKHSKSQEQTARKQKQKSEKSRSEGTSHELTAQPSSNDDQRQQLDTIIQPGSSPVSQEQIYQGFQDFHHGSRMVEGRYIEDDIASAPHEWSSDGANLSLEASEQVLQGPADGLLSASDFENDLGVFDHLGAHIPVPIHLDTQSTEYTLPQWSWETSVTTTQTIPPSAPSSYNASTAAIVYQSTYDPPTTTVYTNPTTTTLNTLSVSVQYQLERWVYENGHDEVTLADRMERYNYTR